MVKYRSRFSNIFFNSDLNATRFTLAFAEIIWAVMLFWPGDTFTRPTYSEMSRLASEELNLGPTEYYENVKAKMFAGAAQPVIAESENEVLIKISNIPYSIGYYHGNFKINTGFGIRTITVQ